MFPKWLRDECVRKCVRKYVRKYARVCEKVREKVREIVREEVCEKDIFCWFLRFFSAGCVSIL